MKVSKNTFIHLIDKETGEETYKIQFDYGTQTIKVKEGVKITLDYVHGGFETAFERVGNDLIIGDDWYVMVSQPLGVGYGKEVWNITDTGDDTCTININKYSWAGSNYGYADEPRTSETITMTAGELAEFQTKHGVNVNVGVNTLYTTWPVLPNPQIHYHMQDCGFYAPANGKIILKNYFLYGKNTVFVGDKLLTDIVKECPQYSALVKQNKNKSYKVYDTFFDENLNGSDKADKIYSLGGDDTIEGYKGNDKIYLGEGNKTIVISQGEGKDIVYNFEKADSVKFEVDTDDVYFTKSGKNLILNRDYGDKTEQTVIKDYFKNYGKDNKIIVSNGDTDLITDFTKEWQGVGAYLKATGSKVIKGTDFNDEAYSSSKNETFALGKGNDIIHFRNDGMYSFSPYSFGKDVVKIVEGSHVTLDFSGVGGTLTYERVGNDALITARYRIEICGRDNGKEEWQVKKVNGNYQITKTKYYFTGYGYTASGEVETVTMTKSEFSVFQKDNGVTLKVGKNTLYTSWAVVPNPVVHYSMKDSANWGVILGSVTLKDYFKYKEDSVYVGNKSLQEYFKNEILPIDKSKSKKSQVITDTNYKELITGSAYSDKITSYHGDDVVTAGKGNDLIILSNGTKTVNINKGDGEDTLVIYRSVEAVNIVFDEVDSLSFDRLNNDMVITRAYDDGTTENTIIQGYYRNNLKNNITVSSDFICEKLSKELTGTAIAVICKYPPVDDIEVIPAKFPSEEECELPGDTPATEIADINQIGQEVTAWQAVSVGAADTVIEPIENNEVLPVLVISE